MADLSHAIAHPIKTLKGTVERMNDAFQKDAPFATGYDQCHNFPKFSLFIGNFWEI